jgi:Ca-activated chloride channel family protein
MNASWLARPEWLWLLAALPALGLLGLWARHRRRRALMLLGGGPAFADAMTRSRRRGPWLFLCLWPGLTLAAVGAAGPQWGRDWTQSVTRGRDLVVVIDLSRSMLAEKPSRLERARAAVLDLCDAVNRRGGHRLGLVLFAGHARLACPLTHDYKHFREVVASVRGDYLDPALRADDHAPSGTRIGEAIELAVQSHNEKARGMQDVLLISDGDDPAGDREWDLRGITAAEQAEIPVHTVGVGDPERESVIPYDGRAFDYDGEAVKTRLEEKPLGEIARRTKGTYVPLMTAEYSLGELYLSRIAAQGGHEHGVDVLPVYRQRAAWFFTPALVLLGASFFFGEGRRLRSA